MLLEKLADKRRSEISGRKRTGFPGDDLLSHPVTKAVPSALKSLASGFEMEPGVSSSLISPEKPVSNVPSGTLKTKQNARAASNSSSRFVSSD